MDEKQTFAERSRDFLKQQGFYIVLFVCLLIVGTAVVLTALPQGRNAEPGPSDALVESNVSGDEPLLARRTPQPSATPAPSLSPLPSITPAPTKRPASGGKTVTLAAAPLDGQIIWGYASDQLLYSRTLDQWTTHAGVDIAADVGTKVTAVLAGTVARVYADDLLGQVVTIEHTNGRVSLYANLDQNVLVTEGQKVNAGDAIGAVGTTTVSECGEAPHLHLGFFVDGAPVDPLEHVLIPH